MAYTLRYYKEIEHPDGKIIRLEIHEKDGVRPTMEIGPVLLNLGLAVQGSEADILSPIVTTQLTMTFVDAPDHPDAGVKKCGDWEEFYTSDSSLWKVIVKGRRNADSEFIDMWGGYVTPDSFSEDLEYRGAVTIVARDNIGHLRDFPFEMAPTNTMTVKLSQVINACWSEIDSPMILEMRGEEDSILFLQSGDTPAMETEVNISAFEGKNMYEALETVLESYGLVMRYIGKNRVMVSSYRSMPAQSMPDEDSLPHIEPTFMAGATRMLVPAAKRIEESVDYSLMKEQQMPQITAEDFSGVSGTYRCKIDGITIDGTSFGTAEHSAPIHPIWPKYSSEYGWLDSESTTLFFNPYIFSIGYFAERQGFADEMRKYMLIAANNVDSRNVSFRKALPCNDMTIRMVLGTPIALDTSSRLERDTMVHLKKISYMVTFEQNGVTEYYQGANRWAASEKVLVAEYDALNETTEVSLEISNGDNVGNGVYCFTILAIEYAQVGYRNVARIGLYIPIQALTIGGIESTSYLQKNTVNTNYNDKNNVIISRNPAFGPAYNPTVLPGIISNGIFVRSGEVCMPTRKWRWVGSSTEQQMAVFVHLQILSYYAKPNNVLEGTIVNGDILDTRCIWNYNNKEHLLVGGTYDLLTGYINGAILREFTRYTDLWGELSDSDLPDTQETSQTDVEAGGSASTSSAAATYTDTTTVNIGGSAGTVDVTMSDSSTNAVQNRVIKSYVDSHLAGQSITIQSLADGQAIVWDANAGTFVNKTIAVSGGSSAWADITGKPTTLAGYGITDALGKSETAAAATKLADNTAFNIWGQTFFSNGKPVNVTNSLYLPAGHGIRQYDPDGVSHRLLVGRDANGHATLGVGTTDGGYNTYISGQKIYFRYSKNHTILMTLTEGKVGIGTQTPETMLHVAGNSTFGGHIYMNNNRQLLIADTTGVYRYMVHLNNANAALFGQGSAQAEYDTHIYGHKLHFKVNKGASEVLTIGTDGNSLFRGNVVLSYGKMISQFDQDGAASRGILMRDSNGHTVLGNGPAYAGYHTFIRGTRVQIDVNASTRALMLWESGDATFMFNVNVLGQLLGQLPTGGTFNRWRIISSGEVTYLQAAASDGLSEKGQLWITGYNTQPLTEMRLYADTIRIRGNMVPFATGNSLGTQDIPWPYIYANQVRAAGEVFAGMGAGYGVMMSGGAEHSSIVVSKDYAWLATAFRMYPSGQVHHVSRASFLSGLNISAGMPLVFLDSAGTEHGITYDEANEAWKVDGNLYATGEISANGLNSGSEGATTAEWYNIKSRRTASADNPASPIYTIIENYDERLLGEEYRIVLLRFLKKQKQGMGWRIPMLTPAWNPDTGESVYEATEMNIAWEDTWWPITDAQTQWFNQSGNDLTNMGIRLDIDSEHGFRFYVTKSRKMRLGVAIFKKQEGVGRYGWQRVSNIAEIMLFSTSNETIDTRVIL